MGAAVSVAVLLAAATLFLGSVLVVTSTVPNEPFPMWRNPTHHRGASIGLRLAGVALLVTPSLWGLTVVQGLWMVLPVALTFAPAALAILTHNRAVAHRTVEHQRASGASDARLPASPAGGK